MQFTIYITVAIISAGVALLGFAKSDTHIGLLCLGACLWFTGAALYALDREDL